MKVVFVLIFFFSCSLHLEAKQSGENYIVILVHAKHLDYSDGNSLIKSVMKNKTSQGLFGHAWIYLHGVIDSKHIVIVGGHTGEFGQTQPRYLDGVMAAIQRKESNPIKYLWTSQTDGGFQRGSGGFKPTYGAKISITKEQLINILRFIDPKHYDYKNFILTENQCSSFVAKVASLAGLQLKSKVTIPINKQLKLGRRCYNLWDDESYSSITIDSPDILEISLKEAVKKKKAEIWL